MQKGHKDYQKNLQTVKNPAFNNDEKVEIADEKQKRVEWTSWKNTIRKLVKKAPNRTITLDLLNREAKKLYNSNESNPKLARKEFKAKLLEKITKAKNITVEGEMAVYAKGE